MGVITSIPKPIKLQLQDIHATKSDYVLDSIHYNHNPSYISKALLEISNNKSIQKVVLKLFFPHYHREDLSKPLSKILQNKATVVIYGENLGFFDHPKWEKIWAQSKVTNLQMKFDMMPGAFENFITGVSRNANVKILGFRCVSDYQISKIGTMLNGNTNIYHLQMMLENRIFTLEDVKDGINSNKNPSTPQVGEPISFLMLNKSITTYTIGGYQERPQYILGIAKNCSIQQLILENIDIEKWLRSDWNYAFKNNSNIKEVRTTRGLNTISALILFQSLRKNNNVSSLILEESVFYDHGFLGLSNYLKLSKGIKNLHIRNLLYLSINQFAQIGALQNLQKVLEAVSENNSLVNVYIANHPSACNEVQRLENIGNSLNETFFNVFKKASSLRSLNVDYFRLGSESFTGISEGLAMNSSIEHVSFAGNLVTWEDLWKFTSEAVKNTSLVSVDITNNALTQDLSGTTSEKIREIFENLSRTTIKIFKIDHWFWDRSTYTDINEEAFISVKSLFG